jgi:hypothetical protein
MSLDNEGWFGIIEIGVHKNIGFLDFCMKRKAERENFRTNASSFKEID